MRKLTDSLAIIGLGTLTGLAIRGINNLKIPDVEAEVEKIQDACWHDEELKKNSMIVAYVVDNFNDVQKETGGSYSENIIKLSKKMKKEFNSDYTVKK